MKLIFLTLTLSVFLFVAAQETVKPPTFLWPSKNDTSCITYFLANCIERTDLKIFKNHKHNFIASFKFRVDTLGHVVSLNGNNVVPSFLYVYIDSLLKCSNKMWVSSVGENGKKVISKPFLLPVIYLYDPNLDKEPRHSIPSLDYDMFFYSIFNLNKFDSVAFYHAAPIYKYSEEQKKSWITPIKPKLRDDDIFDGYFLKPIVITPTTVY